MSQEATTKRFYLDLHFRKIILASRNGLWGVRWGWVKLRERESRRFLQKYRWEIQIIVKAEQWQCRLRGDNRLKRYLLGRFIGFSQLNVREWKKGVHSCLKTYTDDVWRISCHMSTAYIQSGCVTPNSAVFILFF